MRIPIREQLALLILLSSLIGLAVISIATWISNHHYVLSICKSRLALTASLKAGQLAANLALMQTTATFISTRVLIQAALNRYNENGNNTANNWEDASADMMAAISAGQGLLLQTVIMPKNASGPAGSAPVLSTTGPNALGVQLPVNCPNGQPAMLGMNASDCGGQSLGYPPQLYPALTYSSYDDDGRSVQQARYGDVVIGPQAQSALLLGPLIVNDTFSLVSITLPVINNTSAFDVLGWLSVTMDARLIEQVLDSAEGLGSTGETLLVGPVANENTFGNGITYQTNNNNPPEDFRVEYVFPLSQAYHKRHPDHTVGTANAPFQAKAYPAVYSAITHATGNMDNSGSQIQGSNEAGSNVASGFATPQTPIVDWFVIVEQAKSEVWAPINRLRDILLGCVFGTAGFMALLAFPLAHFASLPIRRLREATAKTMEPPSMSRSRSSFGSFESFEPGQDGIIDTGDAEAAETTVIARKEGAGSSTMLGNWRQRRREGRQERKERKQREAFRIPGKVKERKVFVKDELSDLTRTFNEMSDELMMQYSRLEERVQQRTAELEQSKKAAEAANESKTLFIANISHELKTPLNGILGMTAVCMSEDNMDRMKRSLGVIYKSGDLLLNLLTDLLTFSKNQVGQHLSLDEKEFRLRDVSSQVLAIFDKQAREGQIDLRVEWEGVQNTAGDNFSSQMTQLGPYGTGRLKDMILWGDLQRILQVVINLVSNSLKFTPAGGSVVLTVRCLAEPYEPSSRKNSSASKQSRQSRQSRQSKQSRQASSRKQMSETTLNGTKTDLGHRALPHVLPNFYERPPSPPPGTYLLFQFEVTDTGPGIPDELQHKIFEPFVQGDLGLSKKFGGTGLGLSICSQLASLMRGSIGVRSTLGSGSTFTMKIPLRHLKTRADSSASSSVDIPHQGELHRQVSSDSNDWTPARHSRHLTDDSADAKHVDPPPPTPTLGTDSQPRLVGLSQPFFAASQPLESPGSQPAAMEKMAAEAKRSGHRIRVLVAEDNKVNQEVVLRMLKLEDIYDVTVAKDGQEALDFVKESMAPATTSPPTTSSGGEGEGLAGGGEAEERKKPFNLIFMDVQMPNVDGLQSTRLIRDLGYQAPIVALSAFAEESNIKDCLESGMNYFLSKPIRRPQLKKVLKEYCSPIPEEDEEATPPEVANLAAVAENATVVVVNNGGGRGGGGEGEKKPEQRVNGDAQQGGSEEMPARNMSQDETKRPVSPVSPLTSG
ncbi:Histidine kinase osmosensor [Saxophila tyrrhenica]|uniref:histidine kinase n=1 Tax=Saxophila tyrrhenica TaxID=1690608 RepID=A0AAV9PEP2_9PEZI|nr:Histidine kinase osmosensor [Saxophila tyrrhenica]